MVLLLLVMMIVLLLLLLVMMIVLLLLSSLSLKSGVRLAPILVVDMSFISILMKHN